MSQTSALEQKHWDRVSARWSGCKVVRFTAMAASLKSWTSFKVNQLLSPEEIVSRILTRPDVSGLTFSGGEPMLQAAGLARVIRLARQKRDLSLIVYSGFTLEKLRKDPPAPGIADLLGEADVFIDGVYIARQNDNRGLRGSSNQRVHRLTGRLSNFDFENTARRIEIHLEEGSALVVGVPPRRVPIHLEQAIDWANTGLKVGEAL